MVRKREDTQREIVLFYSAGRKNIIIGIYYYIIQWKVHRNLCDALDGAVNIVICTSYLVHIYVILLRFTTIDFFHFRPTNRNNTRITRQYRHIMYYTCERMCSDFVNVRGETAATSSKQENITNVIISY